VRSLSIKSCFASDYTSNTKTWQ